MRTASLAVQEDCFSGEEYTPLPSAQALLRLRGWLPNVFNALDARNNHMQHPHSGKIDSERDLLYASFVAKDVHLLHSKLSGLLWEPGPIFLMSKAGRSRPEKTLSTYVQVMGIDRIVSSIRR